MATKASEARSSDAKARAEASFKKEERAKEGVKAMMEYQANGSVVREQNGAVESLRLAKEAADKKAGPDARNPAKPKAQIASQAAQMRLAVQR